MVWGRMLLQGEESRISCITTTENIIENVLRLRAACAVLGSGVIVVHSS